jgi:hypothetical protein
MPTGINESFNDWLLHTCTFNNEQLQEKNKNVRINMFDSLLKIYVFLYVLCSTSLTDFLKYILRLLFSITNYAAVSYVFNQNSNSDFNSLLL